MLTMLYLRVPLCPLCSMFSPVARTAIRSGRKKVTGKILKVLGVWVIAEPFYKKNEAIHHLGGFIFDDELCAGSGRFFLLFALLIFLLLFLLTGLLFVAFILILLAFFISHDHSPF